MRAKPVETEVRHLIDFQHLRLGGWKFFGDLSEALYGYGQVNTLQFWEVLANGSLQLGKAFAFQIIHVTATYQLVSIVTFFPRHI